MSITRKVAPWVGWAISGILVAVTVLGWLTDTVVTPNLNGRYITKVAHAKQCAADEIKRKAINARVDQHHDQLVGMSVTLEVLTLSVRRMERKLDKALRRRSDK